MFRFRLHKILDRPAVFEYIEGFYNSHRPHASLGWLTPDQVETDFGS